jgi:hypothetical protein
MEAADPYINRSKARSPKRGPIETPASGKSVEQLEEQIKENMDNIEAKMRET